MPSLVFKTDSQNLSTIKAESTSIIQKMRQCLKLVNYFTPENLVIGNLIAGNKPITLIFWCSIGKVESVGTNILLPKYYVSNIIHRGNSKLFKKAKYEKNEQYKKLRHSIKFRRMFTDYHCRICNIEFIQKQIFVIPIVQSYP